jgi:hypothetical protein
LKATAVRPFDPFAWKGLVVLHDSKDNSKYLDALEGLIACFQSLDDLNSANTAFKRAIINLKRKDNVNVCCIRDNLLWFYLTFYHI